MRTDALIRKLRSYDKHNHRGQYAVLLHEAADRIERLQTEITVLKEEKKNGPKPLKWPEGKWWIDGVGSV